MSSIYDKASLVLIPSGTKTSKVYSQKPVSGDGDFTFSRSTAATRVNADGNIEKETQNLLLQSNAFDTTWTGAVTTTSGQSGYDGSSDAWLIENTAASAYIRQTNTTSGVLTASIYAKAGNVNWMRFAVSNSPIVSIYFDLVNGVGYSASNLISHDIEDVGNGWHRYSVSFLANSMSGMQWYPADGNNDLGEVGDNIYIQDAQLEQGLVARDYIETTTTAVEGGITDNVPRLDYTDSSCPALLLEPQRSNLVTFSEYYDASDWAKSGSPSVTTNSAVSPSGLQNASTLTSTASSDRIQLTRSAISGSATYSAYVKSNGAYTKFRLRDSGSGNDARFNVNADGTITYDTGTNTSYKIEEHGNGWYRLSFTFTAAVGTSLIQLFPDFTSGGGSAYVWGVQMEAGSYATSYIPTYGSAVTRNDESTNVQSLNTNSVTTANSAYTIFFDLSSEPVLNVADGNSEFITIYSGQNLSTATITPRKYYNDTDGRIRFYSNVDAYSMQYITSTNKKWAMSVNNNVVKFYTDGALQYTYTGTGNHNGIGSLRLTSGGSNRTQTEYSSFLLFNSVLTDAECIDLTT